MTTLAEALRAAVPNLAEAGVQDPARDARLLLAHAVGIGADRMTLHLGDVLGPEAAARFATAIEARCLRQPVSQIIGERQFWGRGFRVTPDVLDPRPDTETLVEVALQTRFGRVLDLGTGSGAILLTLLAERSGATGIGSDLSPAALQVAQGNARRHGLSDRAEFLCSDWFSAVTGTFDLVVSNPPYIAESEIAGLSPEVRDWEPTLALTPGGDGLAAYRAIAAGLGAHLAPGGTLAVEIGPTQAEAVKAILAATGLEGIRHLCDIDGRDRVVIGQRGDAPLQQHPKMRRFPRKNRSIP